MGRDRTGKDRIGVRTGWDGTVASGRDGTGRDGTELASGRDGTGQWIARKAITL